MIAEGKWKMVEVNDFAFVSEPGTLRDSLWLWGHAAGAHNNLYGLPRISRMTPAEAALYMGIPNLMVVRYHGKPSPPFDQWALSFRPYRRIVWSLTGAGGRTSEEEREHVLDLAHRFPNITGFIMDDFFKRDESGSLSLEELKSLTQRLTIDGRKRDLYVVWYDHQLDYSVSGYLDLCDKITFWTWEAKNLEHLEQNFSRLEALAPKKGKLLGCYMWDFGTGHPMPVNLMEKQCRLGLEWLKEGRVEGMIFLSSTICDLELETVESTREWIKAMGQQHIEGIR